MVPVRRYARDWLAHVACGGLGLVRTFGYWLVRLARKYDGKSKPHQYGSYNAYGHPSFRGTIEKHKHAEQKDRWAYEQRNWQIQNSLGGRQFWATVFATFFALLAFLAAGYAAYWSKQQAIEARRQTAISERGSRPYVFPVVIGDKVQTQPASGPPNNPTQNHPGFYAQVEFANYGVVPAIVSRTEVRIITDPRNGAPYEVESFTTTGVIQSDKSIGRGRPYFGYIEPSMFSRLYVGDLSLYIQIRVFYADVVGNQFHTFVCLLQPTQSHDLRNVLQRVGTPDCHDEIE